MKLKRIIILYKITAYSFYFERSGSSFCRNGKVSQKEIKRFRMIHNTHHACLDAIEKMVQKSGIEYRKVCRGDRFALNDSDLIVTVGGDGTFLEGARMLKRQTILGVNSDPTWSVGRFCCANVETFGSVIAGLLQGKGIVRRFPRLRLSVAGQRFHVLNDILFAHANPAAMSRYVLVLGDKREQQKSSGVWVSTAAGSSGAMKSSGGKLVEPTKDAIQYRPRELYVWKKKQYRLTGGFLPHPSKMKIVSMMREGSVFLDGSHLYFPVGFGESIHIVSSNLPLNVVCSS